MPIPHPFLRALPVIVLAGFVLAVSPVRAADTTPDPLSFAKVIGAPPGTKVLSRRLTVTGIDTGATLTLAGQGSPRYSVNGGPFVSGAGTVHANDTIRLRVIASDAAGGRVTARLTVGDVVARWTVQTDTGRWSSAYYPCYRVDAMPPGEVDFRALTHVVHWPVIPLSSGALDTSCFGNGFSAAQSADVIAHAHARHARVLLGVGGNTDSGATAGFQAATTAAHRATFVANLAALVADRGYDGIDINWEEIRAEDATNFKAFIHALRLALDAHDPKLLLTFVPAANGVDAFLPALTAEVLADLDQVNLQTYVMSGPYPGWVTWHNSPLYRGDAVFPCCDSPLPSIDAIVDAWIGAGIPAGKLAISSQFDAFVWSGGSGTTTGGASAPRQEWSVAPDLATVTYHEMLAQYPQVQGYVRHFDEIARVPWIGRDAAGSANDVFISYDNARAIRDKAEYARSRGLGGYFLFELSGDYDATADPGARHPLLNAVKRYVRQGYVDTP